MDILFVHKGDEMNWKKFMLCGLTGWCMEILFTSAGSLARHDGRLIGQTSLWMFPIYGMAACIGPVYAKIKKLPALLRGSIYTVGIFSFEYLTGSLLRRHHFCPWDYSSARTNVNGLIRLDYAPLWLGAGLLFERILVHTDRLT